MYRFSSEVVRKVLLNEVLIARIVAELEFNVLIFVFLYLAFGIRPCWEEFGEANSRRF